MKENRSERNRTNQIMEKLNRIEWNRIQQNTMEQNSVEKHRRAKKRREEESREEKKRYYRIEKKHIRIECNYIH